MTDRTRNVWWGTETIETGTVARWTVGPAIVWIARMPGEWRVGFQRDEVSSEGHVAFQTGISSMPDAGALMSLDRFGLTGGSERITVFPALADRPVVIHSETPFNIMPSSRIAYYVSTPLRAVISGGETGNVMKELPLVRPSDTWFGPSTAEGELCYAGRTSGRLDIADLPFRPHRAVTVVMLKNTTDVPVYLSSLKLPVPNLGLYQSTDGMVWTQPVELTFKAKDSVDLALIMRAPTEAGAVTRLAPPRVSGTGNIITHALTRLIK